MIKNISLITIFVLFAGILIYGAVNRTIAKSETTARGEAQSLAANEPLAENDETQSPGSQESFGRQNGQGNQGQGNQGQGNQGQGNQGQGQGRNWQREASEIQEQISITGVVIQAPAYGVDMILETAEGDVLIGTGPGYLAEQGFFIQAGDSLQVSGIWENDEFKAAEITHLADGTSIILRDEWGRPMWSGAGRRATERKSNRNGI